jgi:hypothetical protein
MPKACNIKIFLKAIKPFPTFIILLKRKLILQHMKTSRITFVMVATMVAASLTFTSCRKKDTQKDEPDSEQGTAQDNNLAENADNDLTAMGSQLSENSTLTTYKLIEPNSGFMFAAACATISSSYTTIATTSVAVSHTVDFGTTGCTGADGRVRKGKVIFNFPNVSASTKWYRNPGFKMVVTSSGYYVDGNLVAINGKTVTNTTSSSLPPGPNPGTNLTWSIVSDIQITKANNEVISWNCNRTKELYNTSDVNCYNGQSNAINWLKAVVLINGSSSGVNAKGENYTATASNLIRDFNCTPNPIAQPHRHPFISGTISYVPGSRPVRTINFGTGTCDLNATITINGQTYAITLP